MEIFDTGMIDRLMKHRRAVKPGQFVPGKRIPDEIVRQAIINAGWAPTHGKTEPWFFKVYTGHGLKRLGAFQSELYKKESGEKFTEAKYQKLQSEPLLCSHIIAICMKRGTNAKIPELEEIEAVACAVQNIWLTITAYGYGGYWSTGGVTYMKAAKPFFDLDEDDHLMGFFMIGEIVELPESFQRKPVEMICDWESS